MSDPLPGKGLFGWLGRQVGHVSQAVKTKPTAAGKPAAAPAKPPFKKQEPPAAPSQVVFRENKIEEVEHPSQPGVKLRRTIIDEVIVEKKKQ